MILRAFASHLVTNARESYLPLENFQHWRQVRFDFGLCGHLNQSDTTCRLQFIIVT